MLGYTFGTEHETAGLSPDFLLNKIVSTPGVVQAFDVNNLERRLFRYPELDQKLVFQIKTDSSIKPGGSEIVTPILRENNLPVLKHMLRHIYDIGMRCNKTCGLHVHVGIPEGVTLDFDVVNDNWRSVRSTVWRNFRPHRQRNKEYCSINFKREIIENDRYLAIHKSKHNTLEFRLFNGQLDFRYVCRAIRFSCLFARTCFEKIIMKNGNIDNDRNIFSVRGSWTDCLAKEPSFQFPASVG